MSYYPTSFGGYFYKIYHYYLADINGVSVKNATTDQFLTYKSGLWQGDSLPPLPRDSRVFTTYYPISVTTAGNATYTDIVNGIITRNCSGASRTDTFPTYSTIIAELTSKGLPTFSGSAFTFYVRNTSSPGESITTFNSNTGVAVYGDTGVPSGFARTFRVTLGTSDLTIITAGMGAYK